MALLASQTPTILGAALTYSAVTAADTVLPNDRLYLHVKTGATNAGAVTIVVPGSAYGQARPDVGPVNVPVSSDRFFGPLVGDLADPTTGVINVNYGGTLTGTTAALIQF